MTKKVLITNSIPYVNAAPHIGHVLEYVQSDVLARFHRQRGSEVFYLTGSDDNALKNVQVAEAKDVPTQKLVDQNAALFVKLKDKLEISRDGFIRTASKEHFAGAQKLWLACKKSDIYKKSYEGLYCVGCEQFYLEDDLVDGKCPTHKKELEQVAEENYFFKLTNYQEALEKLIAFDTLKIYPKSRRNEILSFIKSGLQDFSISRSVERARGWGVPVPGDKSQVIYVWFDALSNYITGLGYGQEKNKNYKNFWSKKSFKAHVIGKDIIRFHTVYWPAMLLSAGLPLPNAVYVHGFLTVDGHKMSKSLGNVVDPFDLIKRFGTEPVRFYFTKHVSTTQDGDYSEDRFKEAYNADLANGLGNLVSRVAGLIEQNNVKITSGRESANLKAQAEIDAAIEEFDFTRALELIWFNVQLTDQLISEARPWDLAKARADKKLETVLSEAAGNILAIGEALIPFLPQTAEKIVKQFSAKKIKKGKPLFERIK
ncbi:MAG: methionine--tRNA ligase [Candidatus Buchananbacteria bacterium CG10_big_fil_rev_8_21_14_0_10_42_9]|uniref:methionine--tRNA ligase n=1 Tax=Candidatus Buchananbacteria bacterium CG10_big_fil_rev_8_21_14_0_10_42_9 TaxID=1974526 RepID=A0A2H0W0C4_9BACT|nr:MAG: methionine--tRNA ligase [Candidatus Buchananbacteria bacterium CG10_big_fil_rev_8_21_14_0_10_42_9]